MHGTTQHHTAPHGTARYCTTRHGTARRGRYPTALQEKFLNLVELEKVEAARRQLCQVLDTESPPDSVTSCSITGLETTRGPSRT